MALVTIDDGTLRRDLEELRARLYGGILDDGRLAELLERIERGTWPERGCQAGLRTDQRAAAKRLAARAIHSRGGGFLSGGILWISEDGESLQATLP